MAGGTLMHPEHASSSSILAFALDLTAQKELERQMQFFLSMTSHELKTPLAALKGLFQLLQRREQRLLSASPALEPEMRDFLEALSDRLADAVRQVDLQAFVQRVILPEALRRGVQNVIFILDNGTTHAPKQLEDWLQAQASVCDLRLHFQVYWFPPNASWLDQIEIWFSFLQRKCLQPNHFVSTADLETALDEFIAYYNQQAQPIHWTYTTEKLTHKLSQKPGAHL